MEKKIPKHVRARIIGKLAELAAKSSLSKKYKQPDSIIIEREEGDRHRDIPVVSETLFKKEYLIPPPKGRLWFVLSGKCHQKINKFLKESPGTLTSLDKLERAEKVEVVLRIFGFISLSQERKVNVEKIEKILQRSPTNITTSEITRIEELEELEELTTSQRKIIKILGESSQKRSELCQKLDLKRETVDNHIRSLKEKGWIARTGDWKDPLCLITLEGKKFLDHTSFQPRNLKDKRIYFRDIKQAGINTNLFKKVTSINGRGKAPYPNKRTYLKNCMLVTKLNLMEELTPMKRAYEKYSKIRRDCRPDFSVFKMNGTVNVYEIKARRSSLTPSQMRVLNKLGSEPWIKTHLIHAEFDFPESIQIEILKINNLPQV